MKNGKKSATEFKKWFKSSTIEQDDMSLYRMFLKYDFGDYVECVEVNYGGDYYSVYKSDFKLSESQRIQIEAAVIEWVKDNAKPTEEELIEYNKELDINEDYLNI